MDFSGNLREFRRRKNLTQEQLASLINVSPQAVSKWETSDTLPDTSLLPEIAGVLDVSIDALFSYGNPNGSKMNALHAVCEYINQPAECGKTTLSGQIERIFNLIIAGYKAVKRKDDDDMLEPEYWDYYSTQRGEPEYDRAVAASQGAVSSDEGAVWLFESKLFPYAAVFMEPEEGYAKIFAENHSIERLFASLGDRDVYKCVMFLLTQEPGKIELSYLVKKAGADLSRVDEIKSKLGVIDTYSIRVQELNVDGKVNSIVTYEYPRALLMLLAAAYACTVSGCAGNYSYSSRHNPILKSSEVETPHGNSAK